MNTKFNYGKIFLLGFGFFGVSVIWGTYNAVCAYLPFRKIRSGCGLDRLFHDTG